MFAWCSISSLSIQRWSLVWCWKTNMPCTLSIYSSQVQHILNWQRGRKSHLVYALHQISMVMEGRQSGLYEVPLVEAMTWAKEAWRSVSPTTISNCWGRTGSLDSELSVLSNRLDVANLGWKIITVKCYILCKTHFCPCSKVGGLYWWCNWVILPLNCV